MVVASVASLAANVAVAEATPTGRVIAAWPSFALIASYELLMRVPGSGRKRVAAAATLLDTPQNAESVRPVVAPHGPSPVRRSVSSGSCFGDAVAHYGYLCLSRLLEAATPPPAAE